MKSLPDSAGYTFQPREAVVPVVPWTVAILGILDTKETWSMRGGQSSGDPGWFRPSRARNCDRQ
jgi:hypothetical protein